MEGLKEIAEAIKALSDSNYVAAAQEIHKRGAHSNSGLMPETIARSVRNIANILKEEKK